MNHLLEKLFMVENFITGHLAGGDHYDLATVRVVPNDVNDAMSGDVREVVVVCEGVVECLLIFLAQGAAQFCLKVLLDGAIGHWRL